MIEPIKTPEPMSYADMITITRQIAERVNLLSSMRVVGVDVGAKPQFNFSAQMATLDIPYAGESTFRELVRTAVSQMSLDASCNDDGTITVSLN